MTVDRSSDLINNLEEFLKNEKERFPKDFYKKTRSNTKIDDFTIHCLLGSGSFGKVILANYNEDKDTLYAIKIIDKKNIIKTKQLSNTLCEKQILQAANFPFILHMVTFFMDNSNVYFVLPFFPGGDLYSIIKTHKHFNETDSKFYTSQICLALEYLHTLNIIHRDLKPENVLIGRDGYVKLTDFGFSKLIEKRTSTLCGTPDYLAPEILLHKGYGKSVDWWAFGVFVYEINFGFPPFNENNEMKRYQKILRASYVVPPTCTLRLADLIENLLQPDLTKRYGNLVQGAEDVKQHLWYREINWLGILNRVNIPPFIPTPMNTQFRYKPFSKHDILISPTDNFKLEFKNF